MINYTFNSRALITIDDELVSFIGIELVNHNFYMSDTYHVTMPLYDVQSKTLDYWATVTEATLKIYVGFPEENIGYTINDLELLFTGNVDNLNVDLTSGTVTITGRDFSSRLIDKKLTQTYVNQTASQLAEQFAKENGLSAVADKTVIPVGNYNNAYTQISSNITEWDFLTFLAQQSDYDLYVKNTTLYFVKKQTKNFLTLNINLEEPNEEHAYIDGNLINLNIGRSLTLAKDVTVRVLSYNQYTGLQFVSTARASKQTQSNATGFNKQIYVFNAPNLTVQQASAFAQAKLKDITKQEITLEAQLIPDVVLQKTTVIKINNTNTPFDQQLFFINSITRTISPNAFTMHVTAKNSDTNSQVIIT